MNILIAFYNFFRDINAFTAVVLLAVIILYNFFALVLAFQIFSFNRLMTQTTFAPIFRFIAIIHVALSVILLVLAVFAL